VDRQDAGMSAARRLWREAHAPVPGVPRWARWAAVIVPLLVVPSSLWRIAFIGQDPAGRGDLPSWTPLPVYGVLLSLLSEALAFTAVGLVAAWGETVPRWLPRWGGRRIPVATALVPAVLGAAVLTVLWTGVAVTVATGHQLTGGQLPANYPTRAGGWQAALFVACYLPLVLWGPLLGALTIAYRRQRAVTSS
jgi:hypothetical protein